MAHHRVVDELTEQIRRLPCVERMILFGSRARGDARRRSDIDLAVACPQASREEWVRIRDLADEAPTLLEIDLVRLDQGPGRMRDTIEFEGVILYEPG